MTESFYLYMTASKIQVRRQVGRLGRKRVETIGEHDWSPEKISTLDLMFFSMPPKCRLYIYLGSSLCKLMDIELPAALRNTQEQSTVARATMQQHFGLVLAEWVFTINMATPPKKSIACAVRRSLFLHLQELSTKNKWQLVSVRPLVANLWNIFQNKNRTAVDSVLIIVEREAFSVFVQRHGALDSTYTFSCSFDLVLIEREISRLDLSFGRDQLPTYYLALERQLATTVDLHNNKLLVTKTDMSDKSDMYDVDFRDKFVFVEYQR